MGKADFKPGRKCGACWRELTGALGDPTQGGLDWVTEWGTQPAELSPRALSRDGAALVLSITDNPQNHSHSDGHSTPGARESRPVHLGSPAELLLQRLQGGVLTPGRQQTPVPAGSVFIGAVKLGRVPEAAPSNDRRRGQTPGPWAPSPRPRGTSAVSATLSVGLGPSGSWRYGLRVSMQALRAFTPTSPCEFTEALF